MDQHFLVIDIGNTNQKIAIYNDAEQLLSLCSRFPSSPKIYFLRH